MKSLPEFKNCTPADPMKRAVEIADAFYVYQKAIEAYRSERRSNVIRFPIELTYAGRTL